MGLEIPPHPRLILTDAEFGVLRARIQSESVLAEYYQSVLLVILAALFIHTLIIL